MITNLLTKALSVEEFKVHPTNNASLDSFDVSNNECFISFICASLIMI